MVPKVRCKFQKVLTTIKAIPNSSDSQAHADWYAERARRVERTHWRVWQEEKKTGQDLGRVTALGQCATGGDCASLRKYHRRLRPRAIGSREGVKGPGGTYPIVDLASSGECGARAG